MLQLLRYQILYLVILKKPGGKDWQRSNNGNIKYGIRVPRNTKEASHFDIDDRNSIWEDTILKELEELMSMSAFRKPLLSLCKSRAKGCQFLPLQIIFDVRVDLRRKSRLVIGGHVVDSYGHEIYASIMNSISARIMITATAVNNLEVIMDYIGSS